MQRAETAQFVAMADYQPTLRAVGLDGPGVFTDPRIQVWRSIPERHNAVLEERLPDGSRVRWHIKRFLHGAPEVVRREVQGIELLRTHGIGTVPLVAWGWSGDGRGFVITDDLTDYQAADKLLQAGTDFSRVCKPLADLAARLHSAGLHHRDLYLCHFFVKLDEAAVDVRLIDAGRVQRLPVWPLRRRWIVKDLAQLWYSADQLGLSQEQKLELLHRYQNQRGLKDDGLQRAIARKCAWIARHDARLRAKQPTRNVSIPSGNPNDEIRMTKE